MRKWKHEQELKEIAMQLSQRPITVVVTGQDGREKEERRKPTKTQGWRAFHIFYGTLLGLNWGETVRKGSTETQAIVDAEEFTYDLIMNTTLKENERIQGYLSFYCPIKETLRNWEEE